MKSKLSDAANHLYDSGKISEADNLNKLAICFDPSNSEAIYSLGIHMLMRNYSEMSGKLVIRSIYLGKGNGFSRGEFINYINVSYQNALNGLRSGNEYEAKVFLINLCYISASISNAVVFYPAIVTVAGMLGFREIAISWCVEGLRMAMDPDCEASMMKVALFLVSMARVDDELVEEMAKISRKSVQDGRALDACYFSILYKKYWDGDDLGSQQCTNEFIELIGKEKFIQSNALSSWYLCRYDEEFFGNMLPYHTIEEQIGTLYHEKLTSQNGLPIALISCDGIYLEKLATKLLESAHLVGMRNGIHLHLMDPNDDSYGIIKAIEEKFELDIGVSVEYTSNISKFSKIHLSNHMRKTYYASSRFIRISEIIRLYDKPVFEIDTDCLFVSDISDFSAISHNKDICFYFDGIKTGPARQFNATFFFAKNSDGALLYTDTIARYITRFIVSDIPLWSLDQAALYCVYRYLQRHGLAPSTATVSSRELSKHIFSFYDDGAEGKLPKLDRQLTALRAAHR